MFLKAKELFLSQGKIKAEVSSPECLNTVAYMHVDGRPGKSCSPFHNSNKGYINAGW